MNKHLPHLAYRAEIDGLRAIAILAVVAFHAFPEWVHGGFVGVDVFFVISGYLITGILLRGLNENGFNIAEFYARRIKRIFPALAVVLLVCLAFGWVVLLADEYKMLGKHTAAGAAFFANFVYWQEAGYFDTDAELKPLLHLWSLGIEEQFYIVWPALIYLAYKARLNLLGVTVLFLVASFAVNGAFIGSAPTFTFFLPFTRAWELLMGALLAYLNLNRHAFAPMERLPGSGAFRALSAESRNEAKAWAGLLLIVGVTLAYTKSISFPGYWAVLPVLGAMLIISAGPASWVNRNILASKLMVFIGLISFPLYLWHWPLLSFLRIIEPEAGLVARFAAVVLSFMLAWLTYQLLEKHVRGRKGWGTPVALAVIMLFTAGAGYNVFSRDGLGFRHKIVEGQIEPLKWDEKGLNRQADCLMEFKGLGKEGYCVRGRARPISVALIGDSHANHLYYGLERHYADLGQGLINIGSGGCPPFYNLESWNVRLGEVCQGKIDYALDYAVNDKSIKTIILSGSSIQYTSGDGADNEMREGDYRLRSTDGRAPQSNIEIFGYAMENTLRRLLSAGKSVVFVVDVPELGFDPKRCVASSLMKIANRQPKVPCAAERPEVDKRTRKYFDKVSEVLDRFPSVKRWNPADYLCDAQYCWASLGGKMLYRDESHLSIEGSLFLGSRFDPR